MTCFQGLISYDKKATPETETRMVQGKAELFTGGEYISCTVLKKKIEVYNSPPIHARIYDGINCWIQLS